MALIFVANVAIVALTVGFIMSVAVKWGWLEWAQVHAPNAFFEKLLGCKFCVSFWMSVIASLIGWAVGGMWWMIFVPFCSSVIARELW